MIHKMVNIWGNLEAASTMPIQQTILTDNMEVSTVLIQSIIHTDNMGANIVMTHQTIHIQPINR